MQEEFEAILDELCDCFINRDLDHFCDLISVPLTLVANPGHIILNDIQSVTTAFKNHINFMDLNHVDTILRSPVALDECEDGVLLGTYESEVLSKGRRIVEPYESTALLRHRDCKWRISSILNTRNMRVLKRPADKIRFNTLNVARSDIKSMSYEVALTSVVL